MSEPTIVVRRSDEIPVVERTGYRYRRYLGELARQGEPLASADGAYGPLRVLDDVVIEPGARVRVAAHDGFETLLYVLDGECRIEDDRRQVMELSRDQAACARLGQRIEHVVCNASPQRELRVVVAAMVAPNADPLPRTAVASFAPGDHHIVWIAGSEHDEQTDGAMPVGAPVRLGIATLEPGAQLKFEREVSRGLYAAVLEGRIELGQGLIDEAGDARVSLEYRMRMQGISRSRVVVANVSMGFVQQLG